MTVFYTLEEILAHLRAGNRPVDTLTTGQTQLPTCWLVELLDYIDALESCVKTQPVQP